MTPPPTKLISEHFSCTPHVLVAIALPAMAAGMGWGIRGQYGHETGAMIAGALASLTLVLLFAPHFSSLAGLRAAALMTAAIGIGGSMTYGQTVGLTQDTPLVGNWEAWRWGMLGLAIKGGLWIGFGGIFLGMGLGGRRYRFWEMMVVMSGLLGLYYLGIWLLNSPYDPDERVLPSIYFSDSWHFEPDADLKPRREVWGGLLAAWLGLVAYVRLVRGDRLAFRLALFGYLAGALGFPGGQCVQSFSAWNREAIAASSWNRLVGYFNWWNMMETTFGAIWGAVLGFGVWWNRRWIPTTRPADHVSLDPAWEVALCVIHLVVLLSSDYAKFIPGDEWLSRYTQLGLLMTILPVAASVSGRFWPFLMVMPVAAAPIVSKSIKAFTYDWQKLSPTVGWLLVVTLPMAILFFAATALITRSERNQSARRAAAIGLLLTMWTYFSLNTVFFDFAWPWRDWSGRTPNQLIFMTCTACLTVFAAISLWKREDEMQATGVQETSSAIGSRPSTR